jgi:hypothetical protein
MGQASARLPRGTPVYDEPAFGRLVLGYTRDVLAFYFFQGGHWIELKTYDGGDDRIGGTLVWSFSTVHPGKECVVRRDLYRRPVFYTHWAGCRRQNRRLPGLCDLAQQAGAGEVVQHACHEHGADRGGAEPGSEAQDARRDGPATEPFDGPEH